jgi:hypothetical protein
VGRDYDPVPGQWYENLEEEETFLVLSVDPDAELIEIQYENGDTEEFDLDSWHELDLEKTAQPEGWVAEEGAAAAAEEDLDDEDWDEDEDDLDEDDEDYDDDFDDRA